MPISLTRLWRPIHPAWLVVAFVLLFVGLFGIGAYRYNVELPEVGIGTISNQADTPHVYISNLGDGHWGKYAWGFLLCAYVMFVLYVLGPLVLTRSKHKILNYIYILFGVGTIVSTVVWSSYPNSVDHDNHVKTTIPFRVFAFGSMSIDTLHKCTVFKAALLFIIVVFVILNTFSQTFTECDVQTNMNTAWICSWIHLIAMIGGMAYPMTLYNELYCANLKYNQNSQNAIVDVDHPWPMSRPLVLVHPHTHTGSE